MEKPAVAVNLPWEEPHNDTITDDDVAAVMHDLADMKEQDPEPLAYALNVARYIARYQLWLHRWQAWARALIKHPDPLTSYGDSSNRRELRRELLDLRAAKPAQDAAFAAAAEAYAALEGVYVCKACRAPIGIAHRMDCTHGR